LGTAGAFLKRTKRAASPGECRRQRSQGLTLPAGVDCSVTALLLHRESIKTTQLDLRTHLAGKGGAGKRALQWTDQGAISLQADCRTIALSTMRHAEIAATLCGDRRENASAL
jgi:hypothetical protein